MVYAHNKAAKMNKPEPHKTTWANLTNVTWREARHKRVHILWFYVYTVQKPTKIISDIRRLSFGGE